MPLAIWFSLFLSLVVLFGDFGLWTDGSPQCRWCSYFEVNRIVLILNHLNTTLYETSILPANPLKPCCNCSRSPWWILSSSWPPNIKSPTCEWTMDRTWRSVSTPTPATWFSLKLFVSQGAQEIVEMLPICHPSLAESASSCRVARTIVYLSRRCFPVFIFWILVAQDDTTCFCLLTSTLLIGNSILAR